MTFCDSPGARQVSDWVKHPEHRRFAWVLGGLLLVVLLSVTGFLVARAGRGRGGVQPWGVSDSRPIARCAMHVLVVYDTTYGNTEQIARAIGAAVGAQVLRVADVPPTRLLVLNTSVCLKQRQSPSNRPR